MKRLLEKYGKDFLEKLKYYQTARIVEGEFSGQYVQIIAACPKLEWAVVRRQEQTTRETIALGDLDDFCL